MKRAPHYLILLAFGLAFIWSCQTDQTDASTAAEGAPNSTAHFTPLTAAKSGITFRNDVTQSDTLNMFINQYILNGGGVAAGDLNNDGLPDLYFTANQTANHLYLNQGNLAFKEQASAANVQGGTGWATGVTIVDVNADGWNDIYICKAGNYLGHPEGLANELYINNGDAAQNQGIPTFTEQAKAYGLTGIARSNQAVFFDFDNDNDLDVYVVNHPYNFFLPLELRVKAESILPEDATDRLYRNDGMGKFTDVTETAGVKNWAFGLSASVGDLNGDGWLDLYVANDYSEADNCYINQGDGTFKPGADERFFHTSNFSMGTAIADINNDLLPDLFVTDMMAEDNQRKKANMSPMKPEVFYHNVALGRHYQYMQNTLQLNNGNGTFSEIAELANVAYTDWSWSVIFEDLDNDGWKDLFISNGLPIDIRNSDANKQLIGREVKDLQANYQAILENIPSVPIDNYAYKNNGDLTFSDQTKNWGLQLEGFTNGSLLADLDRDGDLDLVTNNLFAEAVVFENHKGNANNFLQILPKGPAGNPNGVGVTVNLFAKGKSQMQQLSHAKGFQSGAEALLHFGVGKETKIDRISIKWPDGKEQMLEGVATNQQLVVDYAQAKAKTSNKPEGSAYFQPWPEANLTNTSNKEIPYNDFEREILLPHKYSQLGPKLAAADVNGDGLSDVLIGGAKNQATTLFLQTPEKEFVASSSQPWAAHAGAEDIVAAFLDVDQDGDLDAFLGAGSNEWDPNHLAYRDRIYLNDGQGKFTHDPTALPNLRFSTGCVTAADIDQDGDLDLFVGGRLVPGKYPEPATSLILENDNGKFKAVSDQWNSAFQKLGMVSDATFQDFNQDGKIDLLVVGEWMSPRLFLNTGSNFQEITQAANLETYKGWWYSVHAFDADGDGDLDFVAGNLGLNAKYKGSDEAPFQVYYNDFDENGTKDIVLGYYQEGVAYPLRGRECTSQQIPEIKKKFETYAEFSLATLDDVYGQKLAEAVRYNANWMATTFFENRGDGTFAAKALPNAAQVSAVQAITSLDVDQDGIEDLVIAGNMFQAEVETCRHDASIGAILKGDGKGNFKAISAELTGFDASGDTKSVQLIQTTGQLPAIVVGGNNAPLKVFQLSKKLEAL